MPRRKPVEVNVNHDRWLVSYADFITLLFAFFVVMYSVSQVSEIKHRQLSETLLEAFSPSRSAKPIQVGELSRAPTTSAIDLAAGSGRQGMGRDSAFDGMGGLQQLSEIFTEQFASLIDQELVQVFSNEFWLQIEVKDSILFASASAEPTGRAREIFAEIAQILKDHDNPVQVEGHTDNLPISSPRYPSNWELSAARAASMVKLLEADGVSSERLSAVGYGEHKPAASNASAEGRAQNRRVALMIARTKIERPSETLDAQQQAIDEPAMPDPASGQAEPVLDPLVDPRVAPAMDDSQNSNRIEAIELEDGDLLFSSDPDLPRERYR